MAAHQRSLGLNGSTGRTLFKMLRDLYARAPASVGTLGSILASWLVTKAYEDYRLWLSLGPGGLLPHSFVGWLVHNVVLWPISLSRSAMTTTRFLPRADVGNGHEPNFLGQGNLTRRRGKRPTTKGVAPHRCLGGGADDGEKRGQLVASILTHLSHLSELHPTLLTLGPSLLERSSSGSRNALFHRPTANNSAPSPLATHYASLLPSREICHLHSSTTGEGSIDGGSLHCLLSPADAHEVVAAGWGELHPLAGFGSTGFWWPPTMLYSLAGLPLLGRLFTNTKVNRWGGYPPVLTNRGGGSRGVQKLPATYLMVYPPRDEAEVDVVKEIIEASVGFATGYACGTVARPE